MMQRRTFLVAALAAIGLAGCSGFVPEGATRPPSATREIVLQKINEVRAANGVGPLQYDLRLEAASQRQADLMAAQDKIEHHLGDGLRKRTNDAGYFLAAAENLAGGQDTLEQAIVGWLNSPSHRATMLSPHYTDFGFAVVTRPGTQWRVYWATIYGGSGSGFFRTP